MDEIHLIHFRSLRCRIASAHASIARDAFAIDRRPLDAAIVAAAAIAADANVVDAIVADDRMTIRMHGTIWPVALVWRQPLHANIPDVANIVDIQPMPMMFVRMIVALALHLPAGTCCWCSRNDNRQDDGDHDDDDHDDGHTLAFHMELEPASRSLVGRKSGVE